MTKELQTSIEKLYSTFSIYPFRSTMEGCPCCVSGQDKEKLHTKTLRELTEEDLSRYAFKAMTTWGDTEDFKHYLPRIFELLSTNNFIVDSFVVLGKLEYGKWKTWTAEEQKTIHDFLIAWWEDHIKYKSYFDKDTFIEIYKRVHNLSGMLQRWVINFEDNSFPNYVDLVHEYYVGLTNKKAFKELDDISTETLIQWIRSQSDYLTKGFFHFEQIDREFAERISRALYIFESIK